MTVPLLSRNTILSAIPQGQPTVISRGATKRGFVEGAHIYKHNGMYYLITAEGGTDMDIVLPYQDQNR